jgi:hypothetical protein
MRGCHFANVRLPLELGDGPGQVKASEAPEIVSDWIKMKSGKEHGTYLQTLLYHGSWWWRISGQVYLEEQDLIKAAHILLELCEGIKRGDHVPKEAVV